MKRNSTPQGPGRPKYQPVFPTRKEWDFLNFLDANGVNPKTGKGKNCTKLTLTKFLDRDLWIRAESRGKKKGKILRANPKSIVVRLANTFSEPESKSGMGRKGFVYSLRAKLTGKPAKAPKTAKVEKTPRKTRTPKTADLSSATKQYEELKAILATPTPAVTVTPAPAPEAVAPETAAPAPEAIAAETAAVAVEATSPPDSD